MTVLLSAIAKAIWLKFNPADQKVVKSLTCSLFCPCPTPASTGPWHFCGVPLSPGRSARALSSSVCTPPAPLWMWGCWGLCWPVDSQAPWQTQSRSRHLTAWLKAPNVDLWQRCVCWAVIKVLWRMTELNTHLFTHYTEQRRAQDQQQPHILTKNDGFFPLL